jgi:SanA protein
MRIRKNNASRKWLLGIALLFLLILLPWKISNWRYAHQIFQPELAPSRWLAIVFGAGLRRDGKPSSVLADRVSVAVQLYHQGKVSKILMSGSTRNPIYDEPMAMQQLAIQLGVHPDDILIDSGGMRTYDTCRRARQIFNINSALLVSQRFHLPRALGICEALGMEAIGVSADLQSYGPFAAKIWQLREIPATLVAFWDSYIAPLLERCENNLQPYLSQKGDSHES